MKVQESERRVVECTVVCSFVWVDGCSGFGSSDCVLRPSCLTLACQLAIGPVITQISFIINGACRAKHHHQHRMCVRLDFEPPATLCCVIQVHRPHTAKCFSVPHHILSNMHLLRALFYAFCFFVFIASDALLKGPARAYKAWTLYKDLESLMGVTPTNM